MDTNDLGQTSTYNWTYDALDRLTSEAYANAADPSANYTDSYTLDLTGNRISETDQKVVSGISDTVKTTYTYDSDDRLLTARLVDADVPANSTFTVYGYGPNNAWTMQTDQTVYVGYDATGSIQSQTQYHYTLQGQMSEAVISKGGTSTDSTYTYNPEGIRTSQTVTTITIPETPTTTTTTYLVDENNPTGYAQVLEEKTTSNGVTTTKTYTLGMDVIAQADSTNGTLIFVYDGHGSTRALINAVAQVIQRFAYDAYGNQLTATNLTSAANALTASCQRHYINAFTDLNGGSSDIDGNIRHAIK